MSEASLCGSCGSACQEYLCSDCCRVVSDDLRRIRWLLPELETTLVRLARVGPETVGGKSWETPLPWNDKASRAIDLIQNCITTWSNALAAVADEPLPDVDTAFTIRWMRRNITAFPRLERAGQAAQALKMVADECLIVIDHPQIKTSFDVGPCPEGADVEPCAGVVRVFVPADPDVSGWMRCRDCAMRWETTEWYRACQQILARRGGTAA